MIVEDTRFIVNGKTVICKLWCDPELEIDLYDVPQEAYNMFIVSGRATCSESDTFDLETGKRIAETKARIKAHSKMQKLYRKIYTKVIIPIVTKLDRQMLYDEGKILTQIHRYEKLTGESYQRWKGSE